MNCSEKTAGFVKSLEKALPTLFIVSQVYVGSGTEGRPCEGLEGIGIVVGSADGEKCPRCWSFSTDVGEDAGHPELCARCANVVRTYYQGIEL